MFVVFHFDEVAFFFPRFHHRFACLGDSKPLEAPAVLVDAAIFGKDVDHGQFMA